jgi:hypothetical protein
VVVCCCEHSNEPLVSGAVGLVRIGSSYVLFANTIRFRKRLAIY